jgi:multiple antibiotic resistance protein
MRSLIQATIALLAIADPLGAIPVFVTLTREMSPDERKRAARRAALAVGVILTAAALFGSAILDLFGVSLPAFRAAGGLLVLLMGLEMLGGHRTRVQPELGGLRRDDTILVPFAMPLIAGPGAITTVIALAARATDLRGRVDVLIAVLITALAVLATLTAAQRIQRHISDRGHVLALRFMGLILVAVGAELIFSGIQEFFGGSSGRSMSIDR